MQAELEDMTDDEDEIKMRPINIREQWYIKRDIKVSFKRDVCAPDTILDYEIPRDKWYYKIGRKIGRGSFGKVNLALHKLTRKVVAVKSISKEKENVEGDDKDISKYMMSKIINEEELMQKMRHPNVVKFFEKKETNKHYLFFIELC